MMDEEKSLDEVEVRFRELLPSNSASLSAASGVILPSFPS